MFLLLLLMRGALAGDVSVPEPPVILRVVENGCAPGFLGELSLPANSEGVFRVTTEPTDTLWLNVGPSPGITLRGVSASVDMFTITELPDEPNKSMAYLVSFVDPEGRRRERTIDLVLRNTGADPVRVFAMGGINAKSFRYLLNKSAEGC